MKYQSLYNLILSGELIGKRFYDERNARTITIEEIHPESKTVIAITQEDPYIDEDGEEIEALEERELFDIRELTHFKEV